MKNNIGFTLIEVLIALAILAIALTAVIKATSQNIRDTFYLQNKTVATWVGNEVMNEVRAGILKISGETEKQQTDMLGLMWPSEVKLVDTPNPKIKKIVVKVFQPSTSNKLIELESYLYVQS